MAFTFFKDVDEDDVGFLPRDCMHHPLSIDRFVAAWPPSRYLDARTGGGGSANGFRR